MSDRISSNSTLKLPAKNHHILLYRTSNDETMPLVLPPICINGYYQHGVGKDRIIDEIYSEFEDRATVEMLLEHALGYFPLTVNDLRLSRFGSKTDKEIKLLILESKK